MEIPGHPTSQDAMIESYISFSSVSILSTLSKLKTEGILQEELLQVSRQARGEAIPSTVMYLAVSEVFLSFMLLKFESLLETFEKDILLYHCLTTRDRSGSK